MDAEKKLSGISAGTPKNAHAPQIAMLWQVITQTAKRNAIIHCKRKRTPMGKVRCFGIISVITCNDFGRQDRGGSVTSCPASGGKDSLLALTCSTREKTRRLPAGAMCRDSWPRHPSCGGVPANILPCCRQRVLGCLAHGQAGALSHPGGSPAR